MTGGRGRRSALTRMRSWIGGSVYRQTAFALGGTALAFALLVDSVSYVVARTQLTRSAELSLEIEAAHEVDRMSRSLTDAVDAVSLVARSHLLSNALVDSDGRLAYVVPFLRDYRPGRARKRALTLTDHRGAPIASTRGDGSAAAPEPWISEVVESGRPYGAFTGDPAAPVLVLGLPVLVPETQTAEGALVAELDARSILESSSAARHDGPPTRIRVTGASGRVVANGGSDRPWEDMLSRTQPLSVPAPLDSLGLRLEVGIPRSVAYAPLRSLALMYVLGTLAAVLASVGVARLLADRLTRPVRSLSAEAARIADSGRFDSAVAVEGSDEIAQLARAFNEMLLRLQLTTESRMESLRKQNEETLRSHEAQKRLEEELHQAQKLEAVGRLAAGIAHEINTPTQYIGDNTRFLADSVESLCKMLDRQRRELDRSASLETLARLDRLADDLDLPYVRAEAPRTAARTLDGVHRVATIVRAMREFAHPGTGELVAADLNRAIEATLDVARNEYRYVADVETELGQIPLVTCRPGDLNQVFLNVIVNAAHAIADEVKRSGGRGTIRVRTRTDGEAVVVTIADTGTGIPEAIRSKIFEPFFTTKDVGQGSGQGLAIARSIVDSHQGSITFESTPGNGTAFHIRIPVQPPSGPGKDAR